jgi:hypothetical protein
VKANLAFRLAPAMRPSVLAARVSRAARRSCVVFHHPGKCLDPRGKAELSKLAVIFASASILTALAGIAVDVISLFMALLSSRGISTPSLQAQGEQRRSSYFNNHRDMPHFPRQLSITRILTVASVIEHSCRRNECSPTSPDQAQRIPLHRPVQAK